MKIPLRHGRYLTPQDNEQSVPVAVINETMARQYWPGQSALGRRFKLGDPNEGLPWVEIVGIVGDVRQMGLDEAVKAEMYLPYQQVKQHTWFIPRDLAIRTTGESSTLVGAIRQAIRDVDPDQPISNVATMSELLGEEAGQRRLGMIMLAAFSLLALLLAAIGIYGVLAYFVTQHTNEIGVRIALGATPGSILLMIVKRGMGLTFLQAHDVAAVRSESGRSTNFSVGTVTSCYCCAVGLCNPCTSRNERRSAGSTQVRISRRFAGECVCESATVKAMIFGSQASPPAT